MTLTPPLTHNIINSCRCMSEKHVYIINKLTTDNLNATAMGIPPLAHKSPRPIESVYTDAKQDKDMQVKQPTITN